MTLAYFAIGFITTFAWTANEAGLVDGDATEERFSTAICLLLMHGPFVLLLWPFFWIAWSMGYFR